MNMPLMPCAPDVSTRQGGVSNSLTGSPLTPLPMLNFKSPSNFNPHAVPGLVFSLSLLLGACTSAPKPTTVDEATRRPANDPARIEQLREQVQGERVNLEDDLQRRHQDAYRTAQDIRAEAMRPAIRVKRAATENTIYTARFASGSAQLMISAQDTKELVQAAQLAPVIVVRGRTDAEQDSPVESRLARERAESMRKLLVASGIHAQRIRIQYQGAGDFVADNSHAEGRAQNRRVEVELYGVVPGVTALEPATLEPKLPSNSQASRSLLGRSDAKGLAIQSATPAAANKVETIRDSSVSGSLVNGSPKSH